MLVRVHVLVVEEDALARVAGVARHVGPVDAGVRRHDDRAPVRAIGAAVGRKLGIVHRAAEDDLERLSFILNLTRDLGVNLAGVEIIMNLRQKIESMQGEMEGFIARVREELSQRRQNAGIESSRALVKVYAPGRNTKADKG